MEPIDTPAREPLLARGLAPALAGLLGAGPVAAPNRGRAVLVALAALVALALARACRARGRRAVTAAALGALGAATVAAWTRGPLPADHVARLAGPRVVAVEGRVVTREQQGGALRLVVAAQRARAAGRTRTVHGLLAVTIAHPRRAWLPGTELRAVGRLRRPRNFGNPRGSDYRGALLRRGIRATAFHWDERSLSVMAPPAGVRTTVARVRAGVAARLADRPEPERGYLLAVLLGERRALAPEVETALTRAGLVHVVSVSGFHVAVVAAAGILSVRTVLRRIAWLAARYDVGTLAAAAGLAPVVLYGAVVGDSLPARRALLMYVVLLAARLLARPPDVLRALGVAAFAFALSVPDVAVDPSFQLSFVSVAALVLAARRRPEPVSEVEIAASDPGATAGGGSPVGARVRRAARVLGGPLRATVVASVATAPLTAWHFQQVSLVAPLANLLALPLLGPGTLVPGLVALACLPVAPAAAELLLDASTVAATLGLGLATWCAGLPAAAVATPMPSPLELALAYVLPALWLGGRGAMPWPRPALRRLLALVLVATTVADAGYWFWVRWLDPRLRVTFLSVGQGDAAVIELPRGAVMVVDGGGLPGRFDTGGRLIAPFLRARKIMRVDVLVLSHPQLDHYGGLATLATGFRPREFWSNGARAEAAGFARLEAALAAAGTRRVTLHAGVSPRVLAGVTIDALHPPATSALGVNDASLVLRLTHGRLRLLLTGDLEARGELALVRAGGSLASSVLKVAHHGSDTSSTATLLAAVRPRVAVVSAGADNRFGFPAPAVLARLRAAGAEVWRTDRDGAVSIVSDGATATVEAPCGTRRRRVLDLNSPHPFGSSARF